MAVFIFSNTREQLFFGFGLWRWWQTPLAGFSRVSIIQSRVSCSQPGAGRCRPVRFPHLLDALNGAVALLEADEVSVQLGDLLPRHLVQSVLVYHSAAGSVPSAQQKNRRGRREKTGGGGGGSDTPLCVSADKTLIDTWYLSTSARNAKFPTMAYPSPLSSSPLTGRGRTPCSAPRSARRR